MGCLHTLHLKGLDLSEGHQLKDKKLLLSSQPLLPWPCCVRVMEEPTRLGHDNCSTALSPAPTNWKETPIHLTEVLEHQLISCSGMLKAHVLHGPASSISPPTELPTAQV